MSVNPDATGSIFGRIVTGADVEQWTLALLRRWLGTYLSEVERQHGLVPPTWQRPRSWTIAPSVDKWPEDQLPAIVLVSTGVSDVPLKDGRGRYATLWEMGLGCIVSARRQDEAHRLAMHYGAALYTLLVQRPSLDGLAQGTTWEGFAIEDELDYDDTRSLSIGVAAFSVLVEDTVSANAGPITPETPRDPETDPWEDWPRVETTEVAVALTNDPPPT